MPFYVFFTLTGTPDFLIRKTKIEFATCVFDRHATWSLLLDRGRPKTLKDSTSNFFMPHRKFFDQATITSAKLITISNCFWQFIIAIIFWWEILDEMIIRLLAIFLWLIGREYFGKRFWLQLLSDWWQYLCDWLVGNILVRDFGCN